MGHRSAQRRERIPPVLSAELPTWTGLASGGIGQLWRETTNSRIATGDGIAMAWRAGASVADLEFAQFHPTALYVAGAGRSLISEAVRGEGAYLLDSSHYRFMLDVHPLAELAPRDVVSRAIVRQIAKQASAAGGSHVWLDCRHITGFQKRFPGICALLKKFDLDPAEDLIPVHPAAHYMIGGVRTDLAGRSDVPGLYVVGEAASTGLHGANRLASNSLLEGLVMGEIAGHTCAEMKAANGTQTTRPSGWTTPARPAPVSVISDIRPSDQGELDLDDVRSSLRSAMWKNVGIERGQAPRRGRHARFLGSVHPRQDFRRTGGLGSAEHVAGRGAGWAIGSVAQREPRMPHPDGHHGRKDGL